MLVQIALAAGLVYGLTTLGDDPAQAADKLVANSVCEAQELKARQASDPHLEIEISDEFNKSFPSLEACRSHELAWDPDAPGPRQPIPFSHKHHSAAMLMDCLYCHSGSDRSRAAGVPSVELCMDCHVQFPTEYDEMEGIRILKNHWEEKKPIEWVQVHRLPEHVKFRHNRHEAAGTQCQECHGPAEQFDRLYVVPAASRQYFVPVAKLQMGWCVQCHDKNAASKDCLLCHY